MPQTIGQRLQQMRLSRQISLEKAAEATRVRAHYLQALEDDNYSVMASAAQGRGFLRLYADFLGLNLEQAMSELRDAEPAAAAPEPAAPAAAESTPAPVSAPQTPPASPSDETAVRRPFWMRLLRKSVPEPAPQPVSAAPQAESTPEPAPVASPAVAEPETEPLKKPRLRKSKPVEEGSKPAKKRTAKKAETDDKKKVSMKNRSPQRR